LEGNEIPIGALFSSQCPINSVCLKIDYEFSSICNHKLFSPAIADGKSISCELVNGEDLKVTLRPSNCPLNKNEKQRPPWPGRMGWARWQIFYLNNTMILIRRNWPQDISRNG
jgi:hypothetical protein